MKNIAFICLLTLVMLACKKDSTDTPPTGNADNSVPIPQVDTVVMDFMAKYNVPGMSVAITKKGKLVFAKSYGLADKSASVAVSNNSLFRIASVSKPVTGIAIIKLVEMGKLMLDDKVFGPGAILDTMYGSNLASSFKAITVRHLLNHTCGGWQNDGTDPMFSNTSMTQDELIRWTLENRPLGYAPGAHYAYSNFGYCLLGRVIEKLTGQPYEQWVKTNILLPAGITSMQIGGNKLADRKPSEVIYYGQSGENPYIYDFPRMDAHGGWIASATDLARLMVVVDGFSTRADLLNPASITTMVTPSAANPNYACGWAVNSANNWWHNGSLPGTASEIVRTSGEYCWVLLCNTRSWDQNFFGDLDGLIWKPVNNPKTAWPEIDLFK